MGALYSTVFGLLADISGAYLRFLSPVPRNIPVCTIKSFLPTCTYDVLHVIKLTKLSHFRVVPTVHNNEEGSGSKAVSTA